MSGWKNPDGLILRCVDEEESKRLLEEFHLGFCGGHFAAKTTAHKFLEYDTIGPPYSLMCTSLLGIARNANYSQENGNLLHYL